MLYDKTNIMSLLTAHNAVRILPYSNVCVVSFPVSPTIRVSYAVSVLVPVDNHCIHGIPADRSIASAVEVGPTSMVNEK
jgi:hypothetical protein